MMGAPQHFVLEENRFAKKELPAPYASDRERRVSFPISTRHPSDCTASICFCQQWHFSACNGSAMGVLRGDPAIRCRAHHENKFHPIHDIVDRNTNSCYGMGVVCLQDWCGRGSRFPAGLIVLLVGVGGRMVQAVVAEFGQPQTPTPTNNHNRHIFLRRKANEQAFASCRNRSC